MTLFYIAYGSCSAQNNENHTESIWSILASRPSLWNSFCIAPLSATIIDLDPFMAEWQRGNCCMNIGMVL